MLLTEWISISFLIGKEIDLLYICDIQSLLCQLPVSLFWIVWRFYAFMQSVTFLKNFFDDSFFQTDHFVSRIRTSVLIVNQVKISRRIYLQKEIQSFIKFSAGSVIHKCILLHRAVNIYTYSWHFNDVIYEMRWYCGCYERKVCVCVFSKLQMARSGKREKVEKENDVKKAQRKMQAIRCCLWQKRLLFRLNCCARFSS